MTNSFLTYLFLGGWPSDRINGHFDEYSIARRAGTSSNVGADRTMPESGDQFLECSFRIMSSRLSRLGSYGGDHRVRIEPTSRRNSIC